MHEQTPNDVKKESQPKRKKKKAKFRRVQNEDEVFEVEAILGKRVRKRAIEYEAKWKGYDLEAENTWCVLLGETAKAIITYIYQSNFTCLTSFRCYREPAANLDSTKACLLHLP